MNTLAFLVVFGAVSRGLGGIEVASECPSWPVVAIEHEGQDHEIVTVSNGSTTARCWKGEVVTVSVPIRDGDEARNALASRWGASSWEPFVDEYTWDDGETVARLEYTDESLLSVSDRALLMQWSLARKRDIYVSLYAED